LTAETVDADEVLTAGCARGEGERHALLAHALIACGHTSPDRHSRCGPFRDATDSAWNALKILFAFARRAFQRASVHVDNAGLPGGTIAAMKARATPEAGVITLAVHRVFRSPVPCVLASRLSRRVTMLR
jgi:hypothetical protein